MNPRFAWWIVAMVFGAALGLVVVTVSVADARAQAAAEKPAEPDVEEIILVPAALWTKMRDAVLYWHDEAQRYKAMKGCA